MGWVRIGPVWQYDTSIGNLRAFARDHYKVVEMTIAEQLIDSLLESGRKSWWLNIETGKSIDVSNTTHNSVLIDTPKKLGITGLAAKLVSDHYRTGSIPKTSKETKIFDNALDSAFEIWVRVTGYGSEIAFDIEYLDYSMLGAIQDFLMVKRIKVKFISIVMGSGSRKVYLVPFDDFSSAGSIGDLRSFIVR